MIFMRRLSVWQGGNLNRMSIHQQDVETPYGTVATALVLPDEIEGRNLIALRFPLFPSFL